MSHGQEPAENAEVKIRGGKIKKQPILQSDQPNKKPTALPTVPNPSLSSAKPSSNPAMGTVRTQPMTPGPGTTSNSDVFATNKPAPKAKKAVEITKADTPKPAQVTKPSATKKTETTITPGKSSLKTPKKTKK